MNWWRMTLWVGIVLLVAGFLWLVRGILLPFLLSLVIAVVLEPVVTAFQRVHIPRVLTAGVLTLGFFALIAGAVALASPFVAEQAGGLVVRAQATYEKLASQDPEATFRQIDAFLEENSGLLAQFDIPATREGLVDKYVAPNEERLTQGARDFLTGGVVGIFAFGSQLFLLVFTPIFVFYLLKDMDQFRLRLASWIPPSIRAGTLRALGEISGVFKSYLRGLVTTILVYGALMTGVMYAMDVKAFIVLGALMGILYLIPIVGAIISSTIVFLVLLVTQQTGTVAGFAITVPLYYAAAVVAGLFLVGFVYDAAVNPRIVGKAVELHPLVAVFVVFSASALFGLPGMLVAYPIAGIVKITLEKLLRVSTSDEGSIRLPAVPLRHRTVEA